MLKNASAIALSTLLAAIAMSQPALARDCSKLKATGNPEYPPYLFRESLESKRLIGANTEIMQMIAKGLDVEIEVTYTGPWSRAQKEVREGRYDFLAGAFFTVPRIQYMDYVYPAFLTTRSVVWSNRERPVDYRAKEDLAKYKGITVIHNSFGQAFDSFAKENLDITTVPNLKQAFKMMNLGRVDYLLYERSPAMAYTSIWDIDQLVEVTGPSISAEGLYLTLSHRSPCNTGELRGKLAKVVREIVEQGLAEKALESGLATWQTLN